MLRERFGYEIGLGMFRLRSCMQVWKLRCVLNGHKEVSERLIMDLGRTAGDPVEMAVDTAARGGAGTFGRGKTEKRRREGWRWTLTAVKSKFF